jgi:hypothetical protein
MRSQYQPYFSNPTMSDTSLSYPSLEPLELTTLLIRHYGIHCGLWTLHVDFHTSGHNYVPTGKDTAYPAVVTGVRSLGLRRVETADALTVDAAAVNPIR